GSRYTAAPALTQYRVLWSTRSPDTSEIITEAFSTRCIATAVLPDGRVIAVAASWDTTVQVWDLTTATPIGDPITGHTDAVEAVATAVLPDGRVIAVTGGWDGTVRVWDLATATPIG